MIFKRFVGWAMIFGLTYVASGQSADEQLLQNADRVRFIDAPSYVASSTVIAERPGSRGEASLKIYSKRFLDGSRIRIEFVAPENLKGTVYLVIADDIYLWQPGLLQPIRISGQQKIFGDASIAEAAGIQFSGRYAVQTKQDEKLNDQDTLKLTLQATTEKVAFAKVTLWLAQKDLKPVQGILHAVSGEPLKKILYNKYAKTGDDEYAAEIAIEDLLFKNFKTTMQIPQITMQNLPDELFDPKKLGK
ncbi:outer membrane lipoprotein-sorting protein [Candidatus Acetothermia bacterium]|nr:outer membrane lipoprotein-sorting protein [Candidatus Acetothermia bacterium]